MCLGALDTRCRCKSTNQLIYPLATFRRTPTQLFKFTILLRPHADFLVDRYSEREEKKKEGGRLLSQAEKEARARKEKQTASADAAGSGASSSS